MSNHSTHPAVAKRLKRSQGHLRKVIEMIETTQPCLDIAQQLYAVERAIQEAKSTLIHDHVEHCLAEVAANERDRKTQLAEFRQITRYL